MTGLANETWVIGAGIVVFGVYSLVLAGIGYLGYRNMIDIRGFALGRQSVRGWWVGISFGATYASANMFIGVPGLGYTHGTAALWWTTLGFGLPFLALIGVGKIAFQQHGGAEDGSLTLPEWVGSRYQSPGLRIGAGLVSLFLMFYVAGQLVGAATLIKSLFDIPYLLGAVFSLVLIVAYVAAGGMYSTIVTDFLQGIVMSLIAVVAFVSLTWVLDVDLLSVPSRVVTDLEAIDQTLTGAFSAGSILFGGPLAILSISWLLFVFMLLPHLLNRIYVLDSERDLKGFLLGSGVSLWAMSSFMIWIGLAGRTMFPDLAYPDAVVPQYIVRAFPTWAALLILVGILSATLTTADSLLQALGSIVANDIYRPCTAYIRGNEPNNRSQLLAARVGIVLVGIAAFATATARPESLFLLTQIGITGLLSGLSIPVLAGYFWPTAPRRSAEAGFVTGTLIYFGVFPTGLLESQFTTLLIASVGNAAAFLITGLLFGTDASRNEVAVTTSKTSSTDKS